MAAGFGVAAVRALVQSLPMPSVRPNRRSAPQQSNASGASGSEDASRCEPSVPTLPTSADMENAPIAEGSDDESASSDEEESDAEPSNVTTGRSAARSRTLSTSEIPDPSTFLDSRALATYGRLLSQRDVVSSDGDSEASQMDREGVDTDAEDMFSDPCPPERTKARRHFPAPVEYLTRQELVDLREGFG
eukprot:TRINITY_DN8764_c1_g4_i1.p2 TRINITY_DN8764_c1_g4~~TRINITY_DN8764_c1_g4_i1.p2  ORF type:complete len:190 (-),score=35.93 TRINITY_DN8764_c1_g4_i1:61-630(-)